MADIPQPDAQFDAMWTAFMAYATPNLANLGLGLGDPEWTNLLAAKTDWDTKYPAHITAQANAESARAGKDVSRATGEALLRALIIILRANTTDVSAAELEALGLSLYDTTRTPSPVPTTRPVLQVDTSQRQRHTLSWADEITPTSPRKPDGVRGVELYVKIGGAAPTGIAECEFVTLDTKTPYLFEFDPSAAGQTAYWIGRWSNTRGETGPISETVAASVVG